MSASSPPSLHPAVRPARAADVPRIRQLILDLATYERAVEQVKVSAEQLSGALFGPAPTVFVLVAESERDGEVVGFALYFVTFSTWEGVHGIYLEDLYVAPEHRGAGLGLALLRSLAALAVDRGYARCEWSVLNWNQPAIDFYAAVGAVPLSDWTTLRLTGAALSNAAAAVVPRGNAEGPGTPTGTRPNQSYGGSDAAVTPPRA